VRAVSLQSAAAAASMHDQQQSLIDRMLMQSCAGNHDNDNKSPSASSYHHQLALCSSSFGFTQEQVACVCEVLQGSENVDRLARYQSISQSIDVKFVGRRRCTTRPGAPTV